jgi:hypothetical protein
MKSWILEGALDGTQWTVIDRRTDSVDMHTGGEKAVSFTVSSPVKVRFIRLTQTAKKGSRGFGGDSLFLRAVEFFGTLAE